MCELPLSVEVIHVLLCIGLAVSGAVVDGTPFADCGVNSGKIGPELPANGESDELGIAGWGLTRLVVGIDGQVHRIVHIPGS